MNNNKTDEAAVLGHGRGVFSKTSYITIGTKEQPEIYGRKEALRSNFKGKQFIAVPSKGGKTPNTYFTAQHDWISEGDTYSDRTRYAEAQPEKAKGFLTGDFRRRDEFSNTIRTEQWREQLKQERKFAELSSSLIEPPDADPADRASPESEPSRDDFLYDRVFEKRDDRFCGASKTHRDTTNPTLLTNHRNLGGQRTTYALSHPSPTSFEKPAYARKPIIRDTFYRKMNVPFSQTQFRSL